MHDDAVGGDVDVRRPHCSQPRSDQRPAAASPAPWTMAGHGKSNVTERRDGAPTDAQRFSARPNPTATWLKPSLHAACMAGWPTSSWRRFKLAWAAVGTRHGAAHRVCRPETPRMSEATADSLILASSSSFPSRWASRERSRVIAVRARGQVPELPDRLRRHERAPDQTVCATHCSFAGCRWRQGPARWAVLLRAGQSPLEPRLVTVPDGLQTGSEPHPQAASGQPHREPPVGHLGPSLG